MFFVNIIHLALLVNTSAAAAPCRGDRMPGDWGDCMPIENIGTMLPYRIAPFPDSSAAKNRGLKVEKVGGKKFSGWGLPGVEIVPTPLESLFMLSGAPQRPYIKKSKKIKN